MCVRCFVGSKRPQELTLGKSRDKGSWKRVPASYDFLLLIAANRIRVNTIWLIWGCALFGVVYLLASAVYLVLIRKCEPQPTHSRNWLRNTNVLTPTGLNKVQLATWRISVLSRWVGGLLGGVFLLVETIFLLFK